MHKSLNFHVIRGLRLASMSLGVIMLAAMPAIASDSCRLTTDPGAYEARKQQSILLMEYSGQVLRAVDGKIRCGEDAEGGRLLCRIAGKGEMLVEGSDLGPHVIELMTDEPGEVHIYPTGDVSCGLASDFGN